MIVAQVLLALVASVCAYMTLAALATPRPPGSTIDDDGRAYAAAIVAACVFVLVLAAELGWYS